MTNGKTSGISQWSIAAVGAIAVAVVSFVATKVWDHESRLTKIEEIAVRIEHSVNQVTQSGTIALKSTQQHAEDLSMVRTRLQGIESQINASMQLLSDQIAKATDDRFRRSEWLAEKKSLELTLQTHATALQVMQKTIDELPPDEWERRVETLEATVSQLVKFHEVDLDATDTP